MLEIKNVSLEVGDEKGKVKILNNINLSLDDKKLYVVTGPNGSGKSSLAKMIMGIYKPTSGEIIYNGQNITEFDVSQRARIGIGYAFQHPPRFKGVKVKELLELAVGNNREVNICDLLLDVGLCYQDYFDREVNTSLSGGELKRIEIATILARDLKLAVFDEPEAGIDLWSFQKLVESFENMHRNYDTTIVLISHQERIINLADEVILMSGGEIQEITGKEKVLSEIVKRDLDCRCSKTCEKGVLENVECSR
ncbi:MAG: ABC transporter ATP-binding protein [Bacillota bacterium]|jgi:Fe-S cluster assembly ATP-binding protein